LSIARSLSNTFAGIAPSHVPAFILAQLLGALAAIPIARVLFAPRIAAGAAEPAP
jgi:glycerol uptake facilitator-like aquaporin